MANQADSVYKGHRHINRAEVMCSDNVCPRACQMRRLWRGPSRRHTSKGSLLQSADLYVMHRQGITHDEARVMQRISTTGDPDVYLVDNGQHTAPAKPCYFCPRCGALLNHPPSTSLLCPYCHYPKKEVKVTWSLSYQ